MMIFVYTLSFGIRKGKEFSTAKVSRAFASREKAEEWLIDTLSRAEEALEGAGDGWKITNWFPAVSCRVMDLEL